MGRDDHDQLRSSTIVTDLQANNVHSNPQGDKKFCKRTGYEIFTKTTFPVNDQSTGRKSFEDHLYFRRLDQTLINSS